MAMGSNTTTYRVETVYTVDDKATRMLEQIGRSAERAGRGVEGLKRLVGGLGGAIAARFGFGAAKSALIDFNSGLEQSRIIMAGTSALIKKSSVAGEMDRAALSVARFQEMAKKSSLTTKDLVDMAAQIQLPLMNAGAGMKDVEQLAFGAANAAKAFGYQAEVAARDVGQALAGTSGKEDRFIRALIEPMGISTEKLNAMSSAKRLAVVQKALTQPAIKEMADAQANTWAGVTSTLVDNLQMAFGKVGLPLFKALTKEVQGWNEWLEKNEGKVDAFAKTLADGLVKGFTMVKDAVSFLVRHADTLIEVAKLWAAVRIGGAVGGLLGGGVESIKGLIQGGRKKYSGMGGVVENLGPAGAAAGAGWMAGRWLSKNVLGLEGDELRRLVKGIDRLAEKDAANQRTMDEMDRYFGLAKAEGAKRGGFFATDTFARLQGEIMRQQDLSRGGRDILAARRFDRVGGKFTSSAAFSSLFRFIEEKDATALTDAGSIGLSKRMAKQFGDLAQAQAFFAAGVSGLTKAEQAALDIDIAQNKVLELVRRRQYAMTTLAKGAEMNAESIKAFTDALILVTNPVFAAEQALKQQAKVAKPAPVNVNIAKVEVAAKDPDRWIQDLDMAVRRRIRAPRGARGALRGGGL